MTTSGASEVFLYLDGDDVGASIELRLLENDYLEAQAISVRVSDAIAWLAEIVPRDGEGQIAFAAGDEVLAIVPRATSMEWIESLRAEFEVRSGSTISCGVGSSASAATNQLRLAKLSGKNRTRRANDV